MSATPEQLAGQRALLHFLQRQGRLSAADAARIEQTCRESDATVHQILEREQILSEKDLAALLAATLRLRVIDLTTYALDPQVARELKEAIATRYGVVPIRLDEKTIDVATSNPLDIDALKAVEFATGKRVQAVVATEVEVRDALTHAYRLQESLEQFLQHVPGNESLTVTELTDQTGDLRTIARDADLPPVVKLCDLMLIEAIKSRSSDVHVEPGTDSALVRYRIDGILEEAFRFPKWVQNPLTARLKIMAKLDITERRVPQDGRIQLRYQDKLVDLRVSSLPSQHGEKITLRILDASMSLQVLDRLGLGARYLSVMREMIRRPQGMVLITGPTGSGKTTTLYAVLREIFSPNISIVTIEDPVEYQLKGINQVEVNDKQGRTFAGVLRSVLRQDPDVILVGEIRDRETAQIAFQAAATGHLVLTTVHTNDAAGAVTRLIDLGLEPRAIASALNLVVAQRLVRRVCIGCAGVEPLDEKARLAIRAPEELREQHRGVGCNACRQSGYAGRLGVYEFLPVTPAIGKLLEASAGETAIRQQARAEGFGPVLDDALDKLKAGLTTAEEILRVVQVKDETARCPGCQREIDEDYAVCPHCSRVLRAACAACGKALDPEWTACPYCRAAVQAGAAAGEPAPPPPSMEARSYRALVVDDTETIRDIVRAALERSDLRLTVLTAGSGPEALALASRERPDVVILDISMPDMDGFEVCRRLRSEVRTAFVPVLMLTAHDSEEFIARGFGVGADDYMIKPFRREDLIARVRRMLDRTYGAGLGRSQADRETTERGVGGAEGIDAAALEALGGEVAAVARSQGALVARLEACEARLTALAVAPERADGSGSEPALAALTAGLRDLRRLVEALREDQTAGLTEVRAEEAKGLAELRGQIAAAQEAARSARETAEAAVDCAAQVEQTGAGVARADARRLEATVERLAAEQVALAAAMAERTESTAERDDECARRLTAVAARLDELEAERRGAGAAAEELAELAARLAELEAARAAEADAATERLAELRTELAELATARATAASERLAALAGEIEALEGGRAADAEATVRRHAALEEALAELRGVPDALSEVRAAQAAAGEDLEGLRAEMKGTWHAALAEVRAAQAGTVEELTALQTRVGDAGHEALAAARTEWREAVAVQAASTAEHDDACVERLATVAARLDVLEAGRAEDAARATELAALAARLDELEAQRAAGAAGTAERLAALQGALEEVRASEDALRAELRAAHAHLGDLAARADAEDPDHERLQAAIGRSEERIGDLMAHLERERTRLDAMLSLVDGCETQLTEFAARLETDVVRRDALIALIDGGEAQLTELASRLTREGARLDTLLSFVDGCETQLAEFARRLDDDVVRRDALMALIDGCETQLAEFAMRITGGKGVAEDGRPILASVPIVDLQERLTLLNAMLDQRVAEGLPPGDPVSALRVRSEIFGQLSRQVEALRAGAPWQATVRKTLSLLVDSTLAATVMPVVRGMLDVTGLGGLLHARDHEAPQEPPMEDDDAFEAARDEAWS